MAQQQPLDTNELPLCQICQLQPIPQSIPSYTIVVLAGILSFVSFKSAICIFLIQYCFAKTAWFCPQCQREVEVAKEIQGVKDNFIIRISNCMVMLSKTKFRIVASLGVMYLIYLLVIEWKENSSQNLQKTWTQLANNCGYQAYLQNSYRANQYMEKYSHLGMWTLQGIYMKQQYSIFRKANALYIKMNPTQFKNPQTQDLRVIIENSNHNPNHNRQVGDIISFTGYWTGREGPTLYFIANHIQKTGQKGSLQQVTALTITEKFIKTHEDEKKVQVPKASLSVATVEPDTPN